MNNVYIRQRENDNIKNNLCCSKSIKDFLTYMLIFTNVYLWCETLQCSDLIKYGTHEKNSIQSYAYNLLFVWLSTFFIIKLQNITKLNNGNFILYFIFSHIGGLGFALLGQVPFLQNIVITNNNWKYWTPAAWIVIITTLFVIILLGIIELRDSIRSKTIRYTFFNLLLILISYSYILYILKSGNAKDIHYHVHHAIFAGILSMWFTKWKNSFEQIMHSILLGIVIEGINFYGIGEFFLFMSKGNTLVQFNTALIISSILTVITIIWLYIRNCK